MNRLHIRFRTQSNIYGGVFAKIVKGFLSLIIFAKSSSSIFDIVDISEIVVNDDDASRGLESLLNRIY